MTIERNKMSRFAFGAVALAMMLPMSVGAQEVEKGTTASKAAVKALQLEAARVAEPKNPELKREFYEKQVKDGLKPVLTEHEGMIEPNAKALTTKGRVERVDDRQILISQELTPDQAKAWKLSGMREVTRAKYVQDRTIFQGRLYLVYSLAINGPADEIVARHVGSEVSLEIKRSLRGYAHVVSVTRTRGK